MIKLVKNTSLVEVTILGTSFAPNVYVEITQQYHIRFSTEILDYKALILDGTLVVNDGTSDLTALLGVLWMSYINNASGASFDNSLINLTVSESNVQKIIESMYLNLDYTPIGKMFMACFGHDGAAEDTWVRSIGDVSSSNEVPYIMPFNSRLISLTFANKKEGAECILEIYALGKNVNEETDVAGVITKNTRLVASIPLQGVHAANHVFSPDALLTEFNFLAGDKLGIYVREVANAQHAKDVLINLNFIATSIGINNVDNYVGKLHV